MAIIGRDSVNAVNAKQSITTDSFTSIFQLDFKIPSENHILVVKNGQILEPSIDYNLDNAGTEIVFTVIPILTDVVYIIFLGLETSRSKTIGLEPILHQKTSSGLISEDLTSLISANVTLRESALIVFKNKTMLRSIDDYSISNNIVTFSIAPLSGDILDFYIHGVERLDGEIEQWITDAQKSLVPKGNYSVGSSTNPIKNAHISGDVNVGGNVNIGGDLVTTISNEVNIGDSIIRLNDQLTGVPLLNAGIEIERGSEVDAQLIFNESLDQFEAGLVGNLKRLATEDDINNSLLRSSNDFTLFTNKPTPLGADKILIEDSADSGNKKYIELSSISASGIQSINTLTNTVQTLSVGISGTDFNISSIGSDHQFNIPTASLTNRGLVDTGTQSFQGLKTISDLKTKTLSNSSGSLDILTDNLNPIKFGINSVDILELSTAGELIPSITNTTSVGSSLKRFNSVYSRMLNDVENINGISGLTLQIATVSNNSIQFLINNVNQLELSSNALVPNLTNVFTIGNPVIKLAGIHTSEIRDVDNISSSLSSEINIRTLSAQSIKFTTNNSLAWEINSAGTLDPNVSDLKDIGANRRIRTLRTVNLNDVNNLNGENGSLLRINSVGANLQLNTETSFNLLLSSNSITRWSLVGSSGHLEPELSDTYKLGSSTKLIHTVHASRLQNIDLIENNTGSDLLIKTGNDAIVIETSGTEKYRFDTNGFLPSNSGIGLGNLAAIFKDIFVGEVLRCSLVENLGDMRFRSTTGDIKFAPSNIDRVRINGVNFEPINDNEINLGTSSKRYKEVRSLAYLSFSGVHDEISESEEGLKSGDLVIIENGIVTKSYKKNDSRVAGIFLKYENDIPHILACGSSLIKGSFDGLKVCDENGKIVEGDLLTSSSTPGYLMKQTTATIKSSTVAKSLKSVEFDENGKAYGVYAYLLLN